MALLPKKLLDSFISTRIGGDDRKKAEYLVVATMVASVSSMTNISLIYALGLNAVAPISLLSMVGMVLALLTLRFTSQVTAAVYLLISFVIMAVTGVSWLEGNLLNTYIFWLAMVPLGVSLVLDLKHGAISAGLCMVAVVLVYTTSPSQITTEWLPHLPALKTMAFFVLLAEIAFSLALTMIYKSQTRFMYNQLAERNLSIENIVNNVQAGFLIIGRDLQIQPGYSRSCLAFFDHKNLDHIDITDILGRNIQHKAHLRCCLLQIFEDLLPEEVLFTNLPHSITLREHMHISLDGKAVRDRTGRISSLLFSINDISKLIAVESINQKNEILLQALRNKEGFLSMLRETAEALQTIERDFLGNRSVYALRLLHSMKGNLSSFGLDSATKLVHGIEAQSKISRADITLLKDSINSFLREHFDVLNIDGLDSLQAIEYAIFQEDIDRLYQEIQVGVAPSHAAYPVLIDHIRGLQMSPIKKFLLPIEGQLQRFSKLLDKPAQLKLIGTDTKVGYHFVKLVQHFPNLIRNALYHGIENQEDRPHKVWPPVIGIAITDLDSTVTIELSDDGKGIDPQLIGQKAVEIGSIDAKALAQLSNEQILQLIFVDGVTTVSQSNELAGRGAAMSAIKAEVDRMGGVITVHSELGQGTTVRINIPKYLGTEASSLAA